MESIDCTLLYTNILKRVIYFHLSYTNLFVNNALISKALGKRCLELNERKPRSFIDILRGVVNDIENIGWNVVTIHMMEGGWMVKTCSTMIPCNLKHLLRGMEWRVGQSGDTAGQALLKPLQEGALVVPCSWQSAKQLSTKPNCLPIQQAPPCRVPTKEHWQTKQTLNIWGNLPFSRDGFEKSHYLYFNAH